MPETKLTLTVPETAERLGIGRNSAYEAARKGDIPTIRIGNRILVPIAALEQLLDGSWKPPTSGAGTG